MGAANEPVHITAGGELIGGLTGRKISTPLEGADILDPGAGGGGGGATTLDDLTDVDLAGAAAGHILVRGAGGVWVPAARVVALDDLSDVTTAGALDGQALVKQADGSWAPETIGGGTGTAATTTFAPAGNIAATDVQAAIQELDTEKSATGHTHTAQTAATTNFTPAGNIAAATVQAAIEELDTEKSATGHTHVAQTAATTAFTPAGGLAAANVQAALEELDTEKAAAAHAHAASAVTFTPTSRTQATDVQTAIEEAVNESAALNPTVSTVAATGTIETLSFLSEFHDITMSANCAIDFSGAPAAGKLGKLTVILRGGYTPSFVSSVRWPSGTTPTYADPAIYTFWTIDGGVTIYGQLVGASYSPAALPPSANPVAILLVKDGSSGTGPNYTTVDIVPEPDRLYLLAVASRDNTAGTIDTPTVTGCGITWSLLQSVQWDSTASNLRRLSVFKGMPTAAAVAGQLSIQFATAQTGIDYQVLEVAYVNQTTPVVQSVVSAVGPAALSGSLTLAAFGNSLNATVSFWAHSTQEASSPKAGWEEAADYQFLGMGLQTQFKNANDTNPTASWATSSLWAGVAVEVGAGTEPATPTGLPTVLGNSTGTEYYIDFASGNDTTGSGTLGAPWKTLEKALATVPASERSFIVNLRYAGGTLYTANAGSRVDWTRSGASKTNPITIRTYPADLASGKAKLQLALHVGSTNGAKGNIRFQNLDIKTAAVARGGNNVFAFFFEGVRNIEVSDCLVHDTIESAIQVNPASYCMRSENVQIFRNRIYDVGTVHGTLVGSVRTGDTHDHGIYWGGNTYAEVYGGAIYNNAIYRCYHGSTIQQWASQVSASQPTARHTVVAYNTLYDTDPEMVNGAETTTDSKPLVYFGGGGTGSIKTVWTSNLFVKSGAKSGDYAIEKVNNGSGNFVQYNLCYTIGAASDFPTDLATIATVANNRPRANPLLSNPTIGDFALLAGSPAKAVGEAAFKPAVDLTGAVRTNADIGCMAG